MLLYCMMNIVLCDNPALTYLVSFKSMHGYIDITSTFRKFVTDFFFSKNSLIMRNITDLCY